MSDPEVLGRSAPIWPGETFVLRFEVAGGPNIFKPADLMMTWSTDAGASNTVVLIPSGWLLVGCGGGVSTFGDGAPGVTGDGSKAGVRAGEYERLGT